MTRETLAFILLVLLAVGITFAIVHVRRNSFERRYRRSLRRDHAVRQSGRGP